MIRTKATLKGEVNTKSTIKGKVCVGIEKIYPKVQNLEVMPSSEEQVFKDDSMNYGEVKVLGDDDLLASNIKQGVEIFGVTGALEEMTIEVKEGINNQEEIITNQETTLEEINQVIQDKILVKEKYKPSFISFKNFKGDNLDYEVANLDTSNLTSFKDMFADANNSNFNFLDLSCWNTSNVTDMSNAFGYSQYLKELNLSSWDTSNVTKMSSMFYYCRSLQKIDIRNFTFDKVTSYGNMFYNVPKGCLIIVKGQIEKDWVLTQRSDFTNVKTIAELEG